MPRGNIRERHRRNPPLLNFEPGATFEEKYSFYDKLEINCDLGIIYGATPRNVYDAFGWIKNQNPNFSQQGSYSNPILSLRKFKRNCSQRKNLLFSGSVRLCGDRLRAFISINPQRYFTHNYPGRVNKRNVSNNEMEALLECPEIKKIVCSATLDGKDNFILDNRLREARRIDWNDLVAKQLQLIVTYLRRVISSILDETMFCEFDGIPNWTLVHAEIAWEFKSLHAQLIAKEFGEYVARYIMRDSTKTQILRTERDNSLTSYNIVIKRNAEEVSIYAKANDRLRIEFRYKGNPKKFRSAQLGRGAYCQNQEAALYQFLSHLRHIASNSMGKFSSASTSYRSLSAVEPDIIVSDFLAIGALLSKSSESEMLRHVLMSISVDGRVSEQKNNPILNRYLSRMSHQNLLKSFRKQNSLRTYCAGNTLLQLIPLLKGVNANLLIQNEVANG